MKQSKFLKKSISFLVLLTFLLQSINGLPMLYAGSFGVTGSVDADGYTIIRTSSDLDNIRNNLSGKFRLYADIDLTGYISSKCTEKNGWYPIGYGFPYFTGVLDGNGHTIKGLWSGKGWGISYKGLFSVLMGATVKNLNIELDTRGITGGYEVGAIAGDARNGSVIENCNVEGGKILAIAGGYAGGLVGFTYGKTPVTISNCTVIGTVTETSGNYSGGLVGVADNGTQIISSRTIGTKSAAYSYAGGLVGALKGKSSILCSYSSGSVSTTASYAGGLVGAVYEQSTVSQGYAVGDVTATHYGGGLIGTLYGKSKVSRSCAYGNITVKNYIAGGLIGEIIDATLDNCYARGDVSGTTGVGGIVGYFSSSSTTLDNSIENCYSTGRVTGKGTTEYGAFNGRSGVLYLGTNYYNFETAGVLAGFGTAGNPEGSDFSFPEGKSTIDMTKQSTFVGWDFKSIWKIDEGMNYPYFEIPSYGPCGNGNCGDTGCDPFDPDNCCLID